ncbi:MAG: hypothetical protein ACRDHM_08840 [Actinomycetota bacterium]
MRLLRGLLLLGIGAAGAVAADRMLIRSIEPVSGSPPIERTEPNEGDPPLVWIDGSLEEVGEDRLVLAEGEGPRIVVERFAGEATRFFRPEAGTWRQLPPEDVEGVETGEDACIEALVDGEAFLAIRVFVERLCAPG